MTLGQRRSARVVVLAKTATYLLGDVQLGAYLEEHVVQFQLEVVHKLAEESLLQQCLNAPPEVEMVRYRLEPTWRSLPRHRSHSLCIHEVKEKRDETIGVYGRF